MAAIPTNTIRIQVRKIAESNRIYAAVFLPGEIPQEAIRYYLAWQRCMEVDVSEAAEPWVPIGIHEPFLILGHYQVLAPYPYPNLGTQPVLLSEENYREILAHVLEKKDSLSSEGMRDPEDIHMGMGPMEGLGHEELAERLLKCVVMDGTHHELFGQLVSTPGWTADMLDEHHRAAFDSYTYNSPLLDLRALYVDDEIHEVIPAQLRKRFSCCCVEAQSDWMFVATPRVPAFELEDHMGSKMQSGDQQIRLLLAPKSQIDEYNRSKTNKSKQIQSVVSAGRSATVPREESGSDKADALRVVELKSSEVEKVNPHKINVTAEQVYSWILLQGIQTGASDIHLEQAFGGGRVRFRVDGDLITVLEYPSSLARAVVAVTKNACGMQPNTFDCQDKSFSVLLDDEMVNLRSSAIPYRKSYQKMALRILPRNTSVDQIHNLGMAEKNLGLMRRAITRRQGLIIVTGPTGEGKTTTLYACLREINKDNINIQTIEDPIERTIEGLNQTEVDNARGVTFAQLMRTMVRQDPNVILLGEIRDKESADLAIEASLTGHLVFATLHANSAVKAILRLKQLGTPPYLLADSLILLQTQRLLKTLCNKCKVAAALSDQEKRIYDYNKVAPPAALYKPKGCSECIQTGYSGRCAIMEMVPIDDEVSEAIVAEKSNIEIRKLADEKGHNTLFRDALIKASEGKTSMEQALRFEDAWSDYGE